MRFFWVLSIAIIVQVQARRFQNIAEDPASSGLKYSRTPSKTKTSWLERLKKSLDTPMPFLDALKWPWDTSGQPGVAVLDVNKGKFAFYHSYSTCAGSWCFFGKTHASFTLNRQCHVIQPYGWRERKTKTDTTSTISLPHKDGFDDIYVSNGPGAPNSLFLNDYPKTGKLQFRDVAIEAGVAATEQDSTGVCYGDINGDGHDDLVVLSEFNSNKLFLANGDTTFREVPWRLATGDDSTFPSASCALGDVNNDGKLDLLISNGVPRGSYEACLAIPFDLNPPNQLFINIGKTSKSEVAFEDRSISSGINDIGGSVPSGKFTLTWAGALIDLDLDGNLDIVLADDQCGLPTKSQSPDIGADRGSIRVQMGDGTGKFKSRTINPVNPVKNGRRIGGETWMGLGFGDFNCDGKMDFFGSNFGDYHYAKVLLNEGKNPVQAIGLHSSRWFLADNSPQGFTDASTKETGATVFGWGNAVWDYDNDGDQDIVMVGSLDEPRAAGSDNPNVIYKNEGCKAQFSYDLESLEPTGMLRNYRGLAIADFNLDGFPDLVAASGYKTKPELLERVINFSSPLDATAYFTDILDLTTEKTFVWTRNLVENGDMMVQINKPDRKKCWVSIQLIGMQGILSNGRFNRGALGSTMIVEPKGLHPVMVPVVSGESFGSQHSPRRNFGLGKKCRGNLEVVWPQGLRNKLYNVRNKEVLTIPEIPCSYSGVWKSGAEYKKCLESAAVELVQSKMVSKRLVKRLIKSMRRARKEYLRRNRR